MTSADELEEESLRKMLSDEDWFEDFAANKLMCGPFCSWLSTGMCSTMCNDCILIYCRW